MRFLALLPLAISCAALPAAPERIRPADAPVLRDLKIVYVKRSLKHLLNGKPLGHRMAKLGFPSNHESHSSLPKSGHHNEIVIRDLETGRERTLYKPKDSSFVGHLDLHWDAQRLLFTKGGPKKWDVWEINVDGSGLRRVSQTPPDVDCYEPCYLPDGRIIVASNAPWQCIPCWHGVEQKFVANLYVMNADGTGMRRLCFDQDHDSNPSVRNNGRVIYSRWDYTGMNRLFLRPLMDMNPDGTGQRSVYGSNSWFPNALYAPRELPGTSGRFVSILTGYHGSFKSGHLVIIDTKKGTREAEGIVQRISGRGLPLEVEYKDALTAGKFPQFMTPFPLTGQEVLVTGIMTPKSRAFGIYLADTDDRVRLIHEEQGFGCFEPIPLVKRPMPPAIPDRIDPDRRDATVYIHDIHLGPGLQGVPRGVIKDLRVISYNFGHLGLAGNDKIGLSGPWEAIRIEGTTPVADDGSATFRIPANTPVAFQALDAEGKAVQLMRTWVTAMPGEHMSCIGCHESSTAVPPPGLLAAGTRTPKNLQPWYGPARGFDFAREVQPVLDTHCVACHDGKTPGAPDLRAEEEVTGYQGLVPGHFDRTRMHPDHKKLHNNRVRYTPAYEVLIKYIRRVNVGDEVNLLTPGHYHADTSELFQRLQQGLCGVKLDRESWDRLATWIDLNAPCHGTWADVFNSPPPNNRHQRRMELARLYGAPPVDPEIIPSTPSYDGTPANPNGPIPAAPPVKTLNAPGPPQFRDLKLGKDLTIRMARVPAEDPFWMSVCEISNAQFRAFDPSHDSRLYTKRHATRGDDRGLPLNDPTQPALRMSWNRAMEFCKWASRQSGASVTLPTESQWELACRADTSTPMSFGDIHADFSPFANVADKTFATFGYKRHGTWFTIAGDVDYLAADGVALADQRFDDGHCVTAPVGSYQPNTLGLKDLHGNAAEWTATESNGEMIVKGGSYLDRPARCAAHLRAAYPPWQMVHNVGFRIIMPE